MKIIALLLAGIGLCLPGQAEEPAKNFYFAGYKAIFIPSDTFRIEVGNPDLGIQEMKDGTLSFRLKETNGPMPKDVVRIYTKDIRRISMIYSELIVDQAFAIDSLSLSLTAGSNGIVNVESKFLQVSVGAGSQLTVKGKTDLFDYMTKGNSYISMSELKAKKTICEKTKVDKNCIDIIETD